MQFPYKLKLAYTTLTVLVVLFTLILQFSISIAASEAKGHSTVGTVIELISFFTILSNLIVAKSLIILLVYPKSYWGNFFSKGPVLTGIAVYITVVGVIYWLVLKPLWHPQGLFKLADDFLHTINPMLYIIYWVMFVPKKELKWKNTLQWLWYPLIYLIYILIRGAITGEYPYPFINVAHLGYIKVLINSFGLLFVFLGFGALFILIARLITKISKSTQQPDL